jgi:hypothetical protein
MTACLACINKNAISCKPENSTDPISAYGKVPQGQISLGDE